MNFNTLQCCSVTYNRAVAVQEAFSVDHVLRKGHRMGKKPTTPLLLPHATHM